MQGSITGGRGICLLSPSVDSQSGSLIIYPPCDFSDEGSCDFEDGFFAVSGFDWGASELGFSWETDYDQLSSQWSEFRGVECSLTLGRHFRRASVHPPIRIRLVLSLEVRKLKSAEHWIARRGGRDCCGAREERSAGSEEERKPHYCESSERVSGWSLISKFILNSSINFNRNLTQTQYLWMGLITDEAFDYWFYAILSEQFILLVINEQSTFSCLTGWLHSLSSSLSFCWIIKVFLPPSLSPGVRSLHCGEISLSQIKAPLHGAFEQPVALTCFEALLLELLPSTALLISDEPQRRLRSLLLELLRTDSHTYSRASRVMGNKPANLSSWGSQVAGLP